MSYNDMNEYEGPSAATVCAACEYVARAESREIAELLASAHNAAEHDDAIIFRSGIDAAGTMP